MFSTNFWSVVFDIFSEKDLHSNTALILMLKLKTIKWFTYSDFACIKDKFLKVFLKTELNISYYFKSYKTHINDKKS